MEEHAKELEALCEARGIGRFSPAEMVELLEEGETAEWIVEQVLPEGPEEVGVELRAALDAIGARVAPQPLEPEPEAPEPETGPGELESMLGQLPDMQLPPGVDMQQVEQLMASPRGALMADFGVFCQERGLSPDAAQDEMGGAMQELHDEWLETPRESLEGKRPSELLEGGGLFPQKVETFRRESPKVGRNDPCPCGSGKKYKRCCGKGA